MGARPSTGDVAQALAVLGASLFITMAVILRAIDAFRIYELALVLAGRVEPVLGTYIGNRYLPPTNDVYTAASSSRSAQP